MATKESLNYDARVPTSLQKVISLKIERLGVDSRKVLFGAATVGSVFEYKLLKGLLGPSEKESLDSYLKELERFDFICEKSKFPQKIFLFKNERIWNTVYNFIPFPEKISIHEKIAQSLEASHRNDLEDYLHQITLHYQNSNNRAKAIEYSYKSGKFCLDNYRIYEAQEHFQRTYSLICSAQDEGEFLEIKRATCKATWRILLLLGHYDLAFDSLERLKQNTPPDEVEANLDIDRMKAEIYVDKGEFEKAFSLLSDLISRCKKVGAKSVFLNALIPFAHVLIFRENIDEAIRVCQEGIKEAASQQGWERGQFYTFLGLADYQKNDFPAALANFKKAMEIYEKLNDKAQMGKAYSNIGMVHFKKGKYEKALENYLMSYELLKDMEYYKVLAITRMNLAVLYDHLCDYKRALKEYNAVLKQSESTGNLRLLMMNMCNMGDVFTRLGRYKIANRYLNEALIFSRKVGSSFWEMTSLLYLGNCESECGNTRAAVQMHEGALVISKKLGNRCKELEIKLELIKSESQTAGRIKEIENIIDEVSKGGLGASENLRLKALEMLCEAEFQKGNFGRASDHCSEGYSLATKSSMEFQLLFILAKAKCLIALNDTRGAKRWYGLSRDLVKRLKESVPDSCQKSYFKREKIAKYIELIKGNKMRREIYLEGDTL